MPDVPNRLWHCLLPFCLVLARATSFAQAGGVSPKICKYPALTQDNQPTAALLPPDPVLEAWRARSLHYVVMGVSGISGADEGDADFAKADVLSLVGALKSQGFLPLPGSSRKSLLIGKDATVANLDEEITEYLPNVPSSKRPLVILYYAGHGEIDTTFHNLALWPRNAKSLEMKYSFSLVEEVRKIRSVYAGDLVIVLDACYSGAAVADLAKDELSSRTAVLASSSDKQTSEAIKPAGSTQFVSAFTYALSQVLGGADSCDVAANRSAVCDATHNGILGINGLQETLENNLAHLQLTAPMNPSIKPYLKAPGAMIGYYCETVKTPFDSARQNEVAAQRLINSINGDTAAGGALSLITNNEALGVVDASGELMATVTAFKRNGKIESVSFDTTIDTPVGGRPARSSVLSLAKLSSGTNGVPLQQSIAQLSAESSTVVTAGIDAQILQYKALEAAAPLDAKALEKLQTNPVLLAMPIDVRSVLSEYKDGKVTFGGKISVSDTVLATPLSTAKPPL